MFLVKYHKQSHISIYSPVESKADGQCSQERPDTVPREQAPPMPITNQREKRPARPPKKKFQKAGLYSDVYKTEELVPIKIHLFHFL